MKLKSIIHPKEKTYFTILLLFGVIIWLVVIAVTLGSILLIGLLVLFFTWISSLYFKAEIYGDSVRVSPNQYPEVDAIVSLQSKNLGIRKPEVFIYNGNGMVNAFAVRFLSKKYILLMADLVDLMLERDRMDELSFIIGHELGHHYAGHVNPIKNVLLAPAKIIPFLGAAYSRACELTADRAGFLLIGNIHSAQGALISLALGSKSLANKTNINAFVSQEHHIPSLMGFIHKIYSTHPRTTKRVLELQQFKESVSNNR